MVNREAKNYLSDEQIIELGKAWMRESKDPTHDYDHAETVEKHSLKILQEYKSKNCNQFCNVDENLVRIAAWWHDCYKATLSKVSFYAYFHEGKESVRIFKQEFENKMEPARLKLVVEAIAGHNLVWKFRFFLGRINPILRVLLEADGIETIVKERAAKHIGRDPFVYRVANYVLRYLLIVFYLIYPFSSYAKEVFRYNLKH